MRIFVFTTVFAPSIGGIETLASLLAEEFVAQGHDVRLMTDVLKPDEVSRPYLLQRGTRVADYLAWLRWCDVHLQFNLSLKRLLPLLKRRRWFLLHQTEYADGAGIISPRDRLKRIVMRAAHNIACSRFVLQQIGCRGVAIGNAYDDSCYRVFDYGREHDLAFVGRLVSEKGCDVLLRALGDLARSGLHCSLTVIGDGPERNRLEALARHQGIAAQVVFRGALAPADIADALNRHRVLVVPSSYREPFGIVALEGLACGCGLIVSAEGGLVEAAGGHAHTFRNGDPRGLATAIHVALHGPPPDPMVVAVHLACHTKHVVAQRYIEVLSSYQTGAKRS